MFFFVVGERERNEKERGRGRSEGEWRLMLSFFFPSTTTTTTSKAINHFLARPPLEKNASSLCLSSSGEAKSTL